LVELPGDPADRPHTYLHLINKSAIASVTIAANISVSVTTRNTTIT